MKPRPVIHLDVHHDQLGHTADRRSDCMDNIVDDWATGYTVTVHPSLTDLNDDWLMTNFILSNNSDKVQAQKEFEAPTAADLAGPK